MQLLFMVLLISSYGLMQSFGNMGPGDMLGLVSAESVLFFSSLTSFIKFPSTYQDHSQLLCAGLVMA